MNNPIILRRRKLGRTSCKEIAKMSTTGIQAVRNDSPIPPTNLVFRWDCTSNVPTKNVVNTAAAIHTVSDKRRFRMILDASGLCPPTWDSIDIFRLYMEDPLPYEIIVRRATHHQGLFLDYCETLEEVEAACAKYGEGNYYISRYIPKVAEYRVMCVQGRVAWVAKKTPADPSAIAWNVAQGGRFDNVRWGDWPLDAVATALEGFSMSGLDFGGVDIMVNEHGNSYILEINSAPSLTSPYRQEKTAACFDWIVRNGKNSIEVVGYTNYRHFVHPAICEEAIVYTKVSMANVKLVKGDE